MHRVVITAVLLAAKFFDDVYYNNAYYGKIGGILVSEMNNLEVDFLFRINFSLHVPSEVFEKYRAELWAQSVQPVPVSPLIAALPAPVLYHQQSQPMAPEHAHITPSPPLPAEAYPVGGPYMEYYEPQPVDSYFRAVAMEYDFPMLAGMSGL